MGRNQEFPRTSVRNAFCSTCTPLTLFSSSGQHSRELCSYHAALLAGVQADRECSGSRTAMCNFMQCTHGSATHLPSVCQMHATTSAEDQLSLARIPLPYATRLCLVQTVLKRLLTSPARGGQACPGREFPKDPWEHSSGLPEI